MCDLSLITLNIKNFFFHTKNSLLQFSNFLMVVTLFGLKTCFLANNLFYSLFDIFIEMISSF